MHNVTIKLDQLDYDYAIREGAGKSANRGIQVALKMQRALYAEGISLLDGVMSAEEWRFLAIILRATPIKLESRINVQLLASVVLEAVYDDVLSDLYPVDKTELYNKITRMNGLHVYAICERCNQFWYEHPAWTIGNPKDEKSMIEFCNQISE